MLAIPIRPPGHTMLLCRVKAVNNVDHIPKFAYSSWRQLADWLATATHGPVHWFWYVSNVLG